MAAPFNNGTDLVPSTRAGVAPAWGIAESTMSMLLRHPVHKRSPKQDRNDGTEDDRFLVRTRPEGAERLQQSDDHRARHGSRKARQPGEHCSDKPLEADQEAGVVVERGGRPD